MKNDIFIDSQDDLYDDEYWAELAEQAEKKKSAEQATKLNFKKGKHTHAYREDLLNSDILQLYRKDLSYQKIADQLGCSKSTVGYRINKLKALKLI